MLLDGRTGGDVVKRLLLALACCGFAFDQASAGERWPDNVCKDILRLQHILETGNPSAESRADKRFGILLLRGAHCGAAVKAEMDDDTKEVAAAAGRAAASVEDRKLIDLLQRQVAHYKKRLGEQSSPAPRQPLLCDTTPKASGGSSTDCF